MRRDKVQLTSLQFAITIYGISVGTVYFPAAGILVPLAGTAGWLAVPIAFGISLPWAVMAVKLCNWAPTGDFVSAVHTWLGPWCSRLLLIILLVVGLWLGGMLLLQGSLIFHEVALPATPPLALTLSTLFLVMQTDLRGMEAYSRTLQILFLLAMPLLAGFLAPTVPALRINNLLPLWGTGPLGIAQATWQALAWVMEGIIFSLLLGCSVTDQDRLAKNTIVALLLAGLTIMIVVMITVNELGVIVTKSLLYPSAQLIFSTNAGSFLQGLELFLLPIWLLTSYVKTTAFYMLASASLGGLLPLLRQPWRTCLLGGAFLAISLLPQDIHQLVTVVSIGDNWLVMSFYLLIPLLLFRCLAA